MSKAIFDRETAICRDLHNNNGGTCNWGECDKCGVIPFMYKIFKDEQIEDVDEVARIKKEVFEQEV
ncbi:MAG: hypothetical protein WCK59_02000 [Candidatus Falkowbacteria bacterium]